MKRVLATTALAAAFFGLLGTSASAEPEQSCEHFGQTHADKAMNGEMGIGHGGHAPGTEHKGGSMKCAQRP